MSLIYAALRLTTPVTTTAAAQMGSLMVLFRVHPLPSGAMFLGRRSAVPATVDVMLGRLAADQIAVDRTNTAARTTHALHVLQWQ